MSKIIYQSHELETTIPVSPLSEIERPAKETTLEDKIPAVKWPRAVCYRCIIDHQKLPSFLAKVL